MYKVVEHEGAMNLLRISAHVSTTISERDPVENNWNNPISTESRCHHLLCEKRATVVSGQGAIWTRCKTGQRVWVGKQGSPKTQNLNSKGEIMTFFSKPRKVDPLNPPSESGC
eukprot:FR736303.1.p2 GENE.FR736303.1~~FR736303.1.p2  ORF type:complete len:113 (+),score=12.00 FR736303.1:721-1059(+)